MERVSGNRTIDGQWTMGCVTCCFLFAFALHCAQSAFITSRMDYQYRKNRLGTCLFGKSTNAIENDTHMMVVFGRPGAGKTTIADCAARFLSEEESINCLGLDLDVCVPHWMRENFARGVYPTLRDRQEFALGACDYVDTKLQEQALLQVDPNITMAVIVSFSFVNTDLRDIYRSRFPHAVWALVDTTETEATDRINQREGHFFKGASPQQDEQALPEDNTEWNFAPVMFPHIILPGINAVEQNSRTISSALLKELHTR